MSVTSIPTVTRGASYPDDVSDMGRREALICRDQCDAERLRELHIEGIRQTEIRSSLPSSQQKPCKGMANYWGIHYPVDHGPNRTIRNETASIHSTKSG